MNWGFVLGALFGGLCVALPLVGALAKIRKLEATLDRMRKAGALVDAKSKQVRGRR